MAFFSRLLWIGAALIVVASGCVRVKTDPIKIEPIYVEITINHRVQKELDDVFADLDKASETTDYLPLPDETISPNN
ncbi:hypothetical protein G0Q06_01080 [Puniceicoccales bacterium CK1056]|uniref:YnbE-like lipoprotein n=1 Tax=Oceanipulchritudo coccoides TaxID=2706888 RepID=A0A6B2LZV9_9BACT|nr:hypothetical protein [Oceanipulchritudo coccoides]NDV61035.1 hypothetical protein [Oceanipulchritudo coccoides]